RRASASSASRHPGRTSRMRCPPPRSCRATASAAPARWSTSRGWPAGPEGLSRLSAAPVALPVALTPGSRRRLGTGERLGTRERLRDEGEDHLDLRLAVLLALDPDRAALVRRPVAVAAREGGRPGVVGAD